MPILSPLTTQDWYSSVWTDLLQCQKRKTTPALASAGELTIDAVHSTDQTELQIIPAFFAMVTRSTQAVTEVLPRLKKYWGKSWGFCSLQPLFKTAFYAIVSDEQIDSEVVWADQARHSKARKQKFSLLDNNCFANKAYKRSF